MASPPLKIVEILFPGVTQLDFVAPHTVFSRLPGGETILASLNGDDITGEGGMIFTGLISLATVAHADILFIPGGFGIGAALDNPDFMAHIVRLGQGARYLTSVCTGSLILAGAGFLKGKRAACHWAWRDMLVPLGAIPDPARVVRDGNIITGGGVTAGLDFALTLAAELAGEEVAQTIQLGIEYAPAPPFTAGRPETAPPSVLARIQTLNAQTLPSRRAAVERAAERLRA